MRQTDRNKLFEHFKKEHLIFITNTEIDDIIELVQGSGKDATTRIIRERINLYRIINVVIFSILNMLVPDIGIDWVVWIFVAYNLGMVIYYSYKRYKNERILRK